MTDLGITKMITLLAIENASDQVNVKRWQTIIVAWLTIAFVAALHFCTVTPPIVYKDDSLMSIQLLEPESSFMLERNE